VGVATEADVGNVFILFSLGIETSLCHVTVLEWDARELKEFEH